MRHTSTIFTEIAAQMCQSILKIYTENYSKSEESDLPQIPMQGKDERFGLQEIRSL